MLGFTLMIFSCCKWLHCPKKNNKIKPDNRECALSMAKSQEISFNNINDAENNKLRHAKERTIKETAIKPKSNPLINNINNLDYIHIIKKTSLQDIDEEIENLKIKEREIIIQKIDHHLDNLIRHKAKEDNIFKDLIYTSELYYDIQEEDMDIILNNLFKDSLNIIKNLHFQFNKFKKNIKNNKEIDKELKFYQQNIIEIYENLPSYCFKIEIDNENILYAYNFFIKCEESLDLSLKYFYVKKGEKFIKKIFLNFIKSHQVNDLYDYFNNKKVNEFLSLFTYNKNIIYTEFSDISMYYKIIINCFIKKYNYASYKNKEKPEIIFTIQILSYKKEISVSSVLSNDIFPNNLFLTYEDKDNSIKDKSPRNNKEFMIKPIKMRSSSTHSA